MAAGSSSQLSPHRGGHALVVGLAEDGAAGDEGVGPGIGHLANVVDLDAAIDLEPDVAATLVDDLARLLDLLQRRGNEALPTEARVHAHDENQIHLVDHP